MPLSVSTAPILGDNLYAKEESTKDVRKVMTIPGKLMFLHASEISLLVSYEPLPFLPLTWGYDVSQRWNKEGPQRRYLQSFRVPVPTKFQVVCRDAKIPIDRPFLGGEMLLDGKPWHNPDHLYQEKDKCWISPDLLPKDSKLSKPNVGGT